MFSRPRIGASVVALTNTGNPLSPVTGTPAIIVLEAAIFSIPTYNYLPQSAVNADKTGIGLLSIVCLVSNRPET